MSWLQGIPFERVAFIDNQPVLDLIEKKPWGLLVRNPCHDAIVDKQDA